MVSLALAVGIIPFLETRIIKPGTVKTDGNAITKWVQRTYDRVLEFTFHRPWVTVFGGVALILLSCLIIPTLKVRLFPYADRDQFAVEIFLPEGKGMADSEAICDSVRLALQQDERIKGITSFIGCSSPRFMDAYAPQMQLRTDDCQH